MFEDPVFLFVLVGVVLVVGTQIVRHGGVSGAMFGARSGGEVGRVEGRAAGSRRVTVAVHRLQEPATDRVVGIHFTGRAVASVSRIGASLSRDAARALADALDEAATGADAAVPGEGDR